MIAKHLLRFIHTVVIAISFKLLFKIPEYYVIQIYHILFIHALVDEHLSFFHFLVIINNQTE